MAGYQGSIRPMTMVARQHFYYVPELFALLVAAPLAWMGFDRTPPHVRLNGTLMHYANGQAPRWPRQGEYATITLNTTPRARDCAGNIQYEIITGHDIWPTLARAATEKLPVGTTQFQPPPILIPELVPPGPAVYRATSFWYCNVLQRWLGFPIVQRGPDIHFTVLPRERN